MIEQDTPLELPTPAHAQGTAHGDPDAEPEEAEEDDGEALF